MKQATFAERLSEAKFIRKMKQVELCAVTGIGKSAMSQYFKGSFEPKPDKVASIASALNVSEAWLMGYDVPMDREKPRAFPGEAINILQGQTRMVPLFESVAAGFGCYANNQIIDFIPLLITTDEEAENTICIKVSGNSMYPKIEDGDTIVVHKQDSVDSGQIGVFLIDNEEGVVKRANYVYGEDWLELLSINPEYMTRRFEGAEVERVKILGLVKQVIKNI